MASTKERLTASVDRARRRWPLLDHLLCMLRHYKVARGKVQAGAVTFFGFLSFFPILALAFFVVGLVAEVYAGAKDSLVEAINAILPGLVGDQPDQISLDTFSQNASAIGIIGLLGVILAGLGWLSGMRLALTMMFDLPEEEEPNLVIGRLRDLATLVVIGVVLVVSVALSGAVTSFSKQILDVVGLTGLPGVGWLLWVIGHLLGIAATMVLFLAMFRLLAHPHLPRSALLQGAFLGGLGFEILKSLASWLISLTKDQPAFQAFGIALVLVVWINYFSRVTMYAAAWAHTAPTENRATRDATPTETAGGTADGIDPAEAAAWRRSAAWGWAAAGATALGAAAVLRRNRDRP